MPRSTKIVITLGPASSDPETLDRLIVAGVDVVEMSTRQHALACGSFYDAILERRLFHHDDQRLDVAVDALEARGVLVRTAA